MPRSARNTLDIDNIDLESSYSIPQVATALNFNPQYIRRLIRNGRIEAFKPNGYDWRISGREVKRMRDNLNHHSAVVPRPKQQVEQQSIAIPVSEADMKALDPNYKPQPTTDATDTPPTAPDTGGMWKGVGFPTLFTEDE